VISGFYPAVFWADIPERIFPKVLQLCAKKNFERIPSVENGVTLHGGISATVCGEVQLVVPILRSKKNFVRTNGRPSQ